MMMAHFWTANRIKAVNKFSKTVGFWNFSKSKKEKSISFFSILIDVPILGSNVNYLYDN
jgi:hypothetical protein